MEARYCLKRSTAAKRKVGAARMMNKAYEPETEAIGKKTLCCRSRPFFRRSFEIVKLIRFISFISFVTFRPARTAEAEFVPFELFVGVKVVVIAFAMLVRLA